MSTATSYACDMPDRKRPCWFCHYHGSEDCKELLSFIISSVNHVSMKNIIAQVAMVLNKRYPNCGMTKKLIRLHIEQHMMHPNIRFASIIHQLCAMESYARTTLTVIDSEGNRVIDDKNCKTYIAIVNQIASMYRLDSSKMLFTSEPAAT
jgi:hypothetical protein